MNMQEVTVQLMYDLDSRFRGTSHWLNYLKVRPAAFRALRIYGFECRKRGWDLKPAFIRHDLGGLLLRIDPNQIEYLPAYLSEAIRKHVNQRAEELNEEAKANREVPRVIERVVAGKKVVEIQENSVEWLDRVCRTQKPPKRKPKRNQKQMELL